MTLAACLAFGAPQAVAADAPPASIGNLERVRNADADIAYRDPAADFSRYKRIMLDDLDLSNVNIVQPSASITNSSRRAWELDDSDRKTLTKAFRDSMTKEFTGAGYPVTDSASDDALRLSVALTDIAPTAPKDDFESRGTGRSTIITRGAGEIAIGVVVRDAQSGEVLAIIKDSKASSSTARMNTSVSNLAEVRRAFSGWARQLRTRLDTLRGN